MRRSFLIALAFIALVGCEDPTGVLVILDASGENLRTTGAELRTRVIDSEGQVADERSVSLDGETTLPVQITLAPRADDATRRWHVEAELYDAEGSLLADLDARGGYVAGEIRVARVFFDDECIGVFDCPAERTCVRGSCLGACVNTDPQGSEGPSERVFCDGCGCGECERCTADGACVPLEAGLRCGGGAGSCRAGVCCEGCWDGATCQPGGVASGCGTGGLDCEACCTGEACEEGLCVPGNDEAISVAAGLTFSCAAAIERDQVFCWGEDGATWGPDPVPLMGSGGALTVASGHHFTCAQFTPSQRIKCWGADDAGQLGDGPTSPPDLRTIVPVPEPPDGSWVASIRTGAVHACALSVGGDAFCWGATDTFGHRVGDIDGSDVPIPVMGGHRFVRLATGELHTCALDDSGVPHCWGSGRTGAQGRTMGTAEWPIPTGQSDPWTPVPLPMEIEPAEGWIDLAAGSWHTCLVHESGELWCVGGTKQGQLGSEDASPDTNTNRPLPVFADGERDGWFAVFAGASTTCGLRNGSIASGGELWCWGRNHYGQLGVGDTVQARVPRRVGLASDWVQVAIGFDHVCGIRSSGAIYCWGRHLEGQLGLGADPSLEIRPVEDSDPESPMASTPRRVCLP